MQTELVSLIAIYAVLGVAAVGVVALRKRWVSIRIVEAGLIFPISFLALYHFVLTLSYLDSPDFRISVGLFSFAGVCGAITLWAALFLRANQYQRSPLLAGAIGIGLLIGCGVALSFFQGPEKLTFSNPASFLVTAPFIVAVHHLVEIGLSFRGLHSDRNV